MLFKHVHGQGSFDGWGKAKSCGFLLALVGQRIQACHLLFGWFTRQLFCVSCTAAICWFGIVPVWKRYLVGDQAMWVAMTCTVGPEVPCKLPAFLTRPQTQAANTTWVAVRPFMRRWLLADRPQAVRLGRENLRFPRGEVTEVLQQSILSSAEKSGWACGTISVASPGC